MAIWGVAILGVAKGVWAGGGGLGCVWCVQGVFLGCVG